MLVGRESETAALERLLDAAREGGSGARKVFQRLDIVSRTELVKLVGQLASTV